MQVRIDNFVRTEVASIFTRRHETLGPLVKIQQEAGSMYFNFAMSPSQAREMAAALIAAADELDATETLQEATS